ncbi:extracellular solute-binding protein [Cellulomonas sp. URHD0024]|uniref:extracellular solute-binding protein n=1 Tax=Cellulomonas sp. URHD0024 TaxID=1302620 RepID=UPI0004083A74|nr:extracellular solute-binding protein [Cellulomonas sp. URHD0024]
MAYRTIRRLSAASLAIGALALTSACSGSGSGSSSDASSGGGSSSDSTIELWTHNGGNEAELGVVNRIVKDFNGSQDKYTVKVQSFPQDSYNDAVVAAASAKKLPCVVDIDAPNVPNWAWAGYLAPLDLPESTWDGQLPTTIGKIGDEVYSYGFYDVALAMFARPSVLQAAGIRVATPDEPWTKAEFADALAKLKATGTWPYPLDLGTGGGGEWIPYAYSPFLQSAGGDLIDRKDYQSAEGVLNGPEALDWANWFQGLVKDGYMAAKSGADATADFVNGKSAILYSGSWANDTVRKAFGDDIAVIPPPDLGEGPKIGGGSWQWGMTDQCKNTDAAKAYLEFAHQTKYFVDFANTLGLIPATEEAAAQVPAYAPGGENEIYLTLAKDFALVRPVTPAYPIISSVFQKATQDILSGGDPQPILDKAAKDIDADIKQNGGYTY